MGRFRPRKRVVEASEPDPVFPVPARFNFTRDVVDRLAAGDAFRHALTFVDHEGIIDRRTFKEVGNDASRWTGLFRARGLVPGDRVVVHVARKPAWQAIMLGALKGGFVAVPCDTALGRDEVAARTARTGARLVVTEHGPEPAPDEADGAVVTDGSLLVLDDLRDELRAQSILESAHDTAASDPALILFTAGTTGRPRGAVHSHGATWAARLQAAYWLDARPADLVWCTAGTGSAALLWNGLFGPWPGGAEIVLHEKAFDVEERFDLIDRLGVTVLCQPPDEYRAMADHLELERFYLGSVRRAVSTGARLEPEVVEAFQVAFGLTIHDGYGQAETTILACSTPDTDSPPGSIGLTCPDYELAVIDEAGSVRPSGAEGELALRGRPPSLFDRYWDDPAETAAAFLGDWYLTGDRARQDADGTLWLLGRARDGTAASAEPQLEPEPNPEPEQTAPVGKADIPGDGDVQDPDGPLEDAPAVPAATGPVEEETPEAIPDGASGVRPDLLARLRAYGQGEGPEDGRPG